MIKRVLIVCVGNICRSPTAEFLLRSRLHHVATIVESAGLAAVIGSPIDPVAEVLLVEHGSTGASHVARQITQALISSADIVLAMEKRHVSAVHAMAPHARGKTFLLGRWQGDAEIADPYGQPRAAFEQAYKQMDEAIESWLLRF
jgi:protein-tyrosine phosphatase